MGLHNIRRSLALLGGFAVFGAAITGVALGEGAPGFPAHRAVDPGPRPNPASVMPQPVAGLNANETALFLESLLRVSELEGTCDTCAQQPQNGPPIDPDPNNPLSPRSLVNSAGMGPVFNADQCFICHSQPQIGGSSPTVNPAQLIAHRLGGTNVVPAFEEPNGAFRETRFKYTQDGQRDGGVHSSVHGAGPLGCAAVQIEPARFPSGNGPTQRRLPHSVAAVRPGSDRIDSGQGDRGQFERRPGTQAGTRDTRPSQSRAQQRDRQPLRLEGPERLDQHVRGRGIQRRDGNHE